MSKRKFIWFFVCADIAVFMLSAALGSLFGIVLASAAAASAYASYKVEVASKKVAHCKRCFYFFRPEKNCPACGSSKFDIEDLDEEAK